MSLASLSAVMVRRISVIVTSLMLFQNLASATQQQLVSSRNLKIVIMDGDGATNNLKSRTAREPIVRVQDENNKPVAGALVVFTLPEHGAGGVFTDGSKSLIVHTDTRGRALARGLQPRNAGQFQIRVDATFQGLTATSSITQTNLMAVAATAATAATAGGLSAKLLTILAVVGGAAAAGAVAATSSNGGSNSPPKPPQPPTISLGPATVGAPSK